MSNEGPKPLECEYCHTTTEELDWKPDPYASELHGDETPHLMCENCAHESAMDI